MIEIHPVENYAAAIDIPTSEWPMNCFAIASAIVKAGLAPGYQPTYGHYFGEVHPASSFAGRLFPRHGWIIGKADGIIIDPTRWVFEDTEPYIFRCNEFDPAWQNYDLGGEQFEKIFGGGRVFPSDEVCEAGNDQHKYEDLKFPEDAAHFVEDTFGHHEWLYRGQMFWLANCSPNNLEDLAVLIYDTIMAVPGRRGMIPIDYRNFVYGMGDLA